MKEFKKYADKQFMTLFEQLSAYELNPDEEVLHRLRVSLKKIKTIFRLISYCSKDFNAQKEFAPLKIIFREAGKIREIDVADKLLKEYNIGNINGDGNKNQRDKLISEFRRNIPRYKGIVAVQCTISENHFEIIGSGCLTRFINLKKEELQKNVYPLLIESKLHKSRKIIKDIIYLSAISRWRKKNLNPLYDEIQEAIGKWHDKMILLHMIRESDIDPAGNVTKKLNLKSRSDLKIIEKLIKDFYRAGDSEKMVIYKNVN